MSEASEATVIRQSRAKLGLLFATAVGFMAWSEYLFFVHPPMRRYSEEAVQIAGLVGAIFFGLGAAMILARTLMPPELKIGPGGLVFADLWRRRQWSWSLVSDFEIQGDQDRTIAFTTSERHQSIPGMWEMPIEDVCDALNAARDRWR